jgi:hypothetical protein
MENRQIAAKMAGAWWAERLADEYAEARPAFAAAVEKRVLQELRGECYWDWHGERHDGVGYENRSRTENDYDPHNCLIEALQEALPSVPAWRLRNALPNKRMLDVTPEKLTPKDGYGNYTAEIAVPAVGAA